MASLSPSLPPASPSSNGPSVIEIGVYIAIASGILLLLSIFQVYEGFHKHLWWFPCPNLFGLNAGTLSVLAIAAKLPNDLTTPMPGITDQLSKLAGTVLICTVMGATMPSLASMEQSELSGNMVALGLLVISAVVNIALQLHNGVIMAFTVEHILVLVVMVILLGVLLTLAIALQSISSDVRATLRTMLDSDCPYIQEPCHWETLEREGAKRWLMVLTSNPQYVAARTATAAAVGILVICSIIMLLSAMGRRDRVQLDPGALSVYEGSTLVILVFQCATSLVNLVPSTLRWWRAAMYEDRALRTFRVTPESFWQRKIKEFRFKPVPVEPTDPKKREIRMALQHFKEMIVGWVMVAGGMLVLVIRFVAFASSFCTHFFGMRALFYCLRGEVSTDAEMERFVVCLEGENSASLWQANKASGQARRLVEKGEKVNIGQLVMLLKHCAHDLHFAKSIIEVLNRKTLPADGLYVDEGFECGWSLTILSLLSVMTKVEVESMGTFTTSTMAREAYTQALDMVRMVELKYPHYGMAEYEDAVATMWAHMETNRNWLDGKKLVVPTKLRPAREVLGELLQGAGHKVEEFLKKQGEAREKPMVWPLEVILSHTIHTVVKNIAKVEEGGGIIVEEMRTRVADTLGACVACLPFAVNVELVHAVMDAFPSASRVEAALFLIGKGRRLWTDLNWPKPGDGMGTPGQIRYWLQDAIHPFDEPDVDDPKISELHLGQQ